MQDLDSPLPDTLGRFHLPQIVSIATIESVASQLQQLDFCSPLLTLDASETEVMSTPGIQLLLALHKTLEARSMKLALIGLRPALAQSFEQLGMKHMLHQWEISNE